MLDYVANYESLAMHNNYSPTEFDHFLTQTVNFGLDLQDFLKDNLKHVKSWQAT